MLRSARWLTYQPSRPVRCFPVYSYLVVYSANTRPVEIVRVLGGAQDIESILN
jgi:hypothetical protein